MTSDEITLWGALQQMLVKVEHRRQREHYREGFVFWDGYAAALHDLLYAIQGGFDKPEGDN